MKKLIFLLFPFLMLAQNPTNFPYGIKNTVAPSNSTPSYFVTQEVDGVHKKTPAALVAKVAIVNDSLATKENVANKSDSYTTSSSTTYASTKAVVDGLATKISGTGTTNYLPKFTSAGVLGNSIVQEVGSEIKITGTFLVDNLITVTNKNQYINLINSGLIKGQTKIWNGSAFVDSNNGLFIGNTAGLNNTGSNIGLISGYTAGQNNTGGYIGLISGYFSGLNNTGSNIGLISGNTAGQSNTGSNIGLISGNTAGQSNTGSYIGLISGNTAGQSNTGSNIGLISGYTAGQNNTGSNIGLISGNTAGQSNTGSYIGLISGYTAGQNNTGSYIGLISGNTAGQSNTGSNIGLISGYTAGQNNTGSNIGLISGSSAGYYNAGDNNILGYNSHSAFLDNTSGIKSASAVDINTEYVTVTNHGFGATNAYVNLRYTTNGTPIGGLSNNGIYKVKIIDANTIYFYLNGLSSAGTGNHSFTPQYQYTNVNIFGNSVNPTNSNQTIIGNPSTTEFIAYGTHLIGTTVNNGVDKLQVNGTISATSYTGGATLTGTPTAPTATAGTNTTQIATTAFVTTADNLKANIASPALTGAPTAPTAAPGTNTTQIATAAFVQETKKITVRKVSTNITLADSDNATVILLTASATITLPNGLMNGFNASFATQTGATLTYSLGGSVVLINNALTSMPELSSHTIVNTGVANEYLTVGL